jgi:hypothetical protein
MILSTKNIKLILITLLLLCLLEMPYSYYEVVRFSTFTGFTLFAYRYMASGKAEIGLLYGCLALLFQPFWKVALGRTLWNVTDVLVAAYLLITVNDAPEEDARS